MEYKNFLTSTNFAIKTNFELLEILFSNEISSVKMYSIRNPVHRMKDDTFF